jgi:hypothetical protein
MSPLKAFLIWIILNCPPETIITIDQRLLIFGLSNGRMLVADVLVAPDALVRSAGMTDVTHGHPSLTCLQVKELRIQIPS